MVGGQDPVALEMTKRGCNEMVLHLFTINWLAGFSQHHRDIRFWCYGFSPNGGGPDSSIFLPVAMK